jgi:PleD family two-component response regulator
VSEEGDCLVVLSHSSDETGVNEFAARIAETVRELGLHHPRSRQDRFVTVSYRTKVMAAGKGGKSAEEFLERVIWQPRAAEP